MKRSLNIILICSIIFLFSTNTFALELRYVGQFGMPQMQYPYKLAKISQDFFLVVDKSPYIYQFNSSGQYCGLWPGKLPDDVDHREYISISTDQHNNIYLTFQNEKLVIKYSQAGEIVKEWTDPEFSWVESLLIQSEDTFYLLDNSNLFFLSNGAEMQIYDRLSLWQPLSIIQDASGLLYIADTNNRQIKVINQEGELINQWGTQGSGIDQFISPHYLAFDDQERLFILDCKIFENELYSRLIIYSKSGELLDFVDLLTLNPDDAEYFYPADFLLDGEILYLLDMVSSTIYKYQILQPDPSAED